MRGLPRMKQGTSWLLSSGHSTGDSPYRQQTYSFPNQNEINSELQYAAEVLDPAGSFSPWRFFHQSKGIKRTSILSIVCTSGEDALRRTRTSSLRAVSSAAVNTATQDFYMKIDPLWNRGFLNDYPTFCLQLIYTYCRPRASSSSPLLFADRMDDSVAAFMERYSSNMKPKYFSASLRPMKTVFPLKLLAPSWVVW